jgi:hypothetical protein
MSWFADLTPYTYAGSAPTVPPTLNVGWLRAPPLELEHARTTSASRFLP